MMLSPLNAQRGYLICVCRTTLIVILTALVASPSCQAGKIDFTPTVGTRVLEGVSFPQLIFRQDGHQISYEPPRDWSYTGDGSRLRLTPARVPQAQAIIEQTVLSSPQALDESMVKQLPSLVTAALPPDATNVQVIAEESSPVRVNQQESHELFVTYSYFGQVYEMSALFANVGDLQLHFRLLARKADFEALHRAFRGSIFSLRWL
jgi:hypothetical protein